MKLLVWNTYDLGPKGGPAGYLYNIKQHSGQAGFNIDFLSDLELEFKYRKTNDRWTNLLVRVLMKIDPSQKKKFLDSYVVTKQEIACDISVLSEYDAIHFHTTYELFQARRLLRAYRGKIILQSHSPKPFLYEVMEDRFGISAPHPYAVMRYLTQIDRFAFKRADTIVFPCRESMDSYVSRYRFILRFLKKTVFLPTPYETANTAGIDIKKELQLPEDSFLVLYAGRHNYVKGYDLIKKAAEEIFKLNVSPPIHFLIAGQESPLIGLQNISWHELGWRSDIGAIMKSSDCMVLLNRETYFDLILLEALAHSLPVILSKTGGNKYFAKYSSPGLLFCELNGHTLANMIIALSKRGKSELKEYGNRNREVIDEYFTWGEFFRTYKAIITGVTTEIPL